MFDLLFQLSIVFLIIMFTKNIMDMKKYNEESSLVELKEFKIEQNKRIMDPLLIDFKFEKEFNLEKMYLDNPLKYFLNSNRVIRYSDFAFFENINIYNQPELIQELNINTICNDIFNKFKNQFSFNTIYSGSIFQGINNIKLQKNRNNILVLGCLQNNCDVYLYNPKHEEYLTSDKRKKWGIKVELKKDKLLYIPTNWFYTIETENGCVLLHIRSDTYFTSIYNEYRN